MHIRYGSADSHIPHDIHPYFRINTDRDKHLEIIRFGILRQYLLSGCLHLSIFVFLLFVLEWICIFVNLRGSGMGKKYLDAAKIRKEI